MKANNTNSTISVEDIIKALIEVDPLTHSLDWDEICIAPTLDKCFNQFSPEDKIEKVQKVINGCREIENCLISYIITDTGTRTKKIIKEYHEKKEQIIAEGIKGKKQTFTANEVIKISGSSRNTIYNHLKNGTLRGIQNDSGGWTITREALQEYLHRDDF